MQIFNTPIEYLKGVGPQRAEVLKKEIGVFTYQDLLHYYPFRYIDKTRYYKINEIGFDFPLVQILVRLKSFEVIGEKQSKRLVARVVDETGELELVWFKGLKWIEKTLKINHLYVVFGKPTFFNGKPQMAHPEMELFSKESKERGNLSLQPVYSSTEKLKQFSLDSKGIQKLMSNLLDTVFSEIEEVLPSYILEKYKLLSRRDALLQIHFPTNSTVLSRAQATLKFEELFFIQLKLLKIKHLRTLKFKGNVFATVGNKFNYFYENLLPFQLTGAQKRVLKEIRFDSQKGIQMNRLVQGDVGSGKTVVALMSMLLAIDNGFQACMMAPTEILATQHYASIKSMLPDDFVNIALLTGSTKKKDRKKILEDLVIGTLNILVGTHALIEETVVFKHLGLAVIDEQHRFGVEQRAKLWKKNLIPPHVLVMTATPIPRTLAMSLYGDLDVSVINELPAGRKPIQTIHLYENQRLRMFGYMRREIAKGRQVYVVYPLIQESAKLDLKNLQDGIEVLSREFPLPQYKISIVHGQLKPDEKEFEMQRFIKGQTQIMVATTVIEVGVNVPNASVMIIENAERFGLSQLHQLRGRVGRGSEQSFCILMSKDKLSKEGKVRLETMVKTNDGFEISEVDLQLRGPGDIEGTQQSGILDLKLADLTQDQNILHEARKTVLEIMEADPELQNAEHQILGNFFHKHNTGITLDKIS
ncbi:ATP-dependent DNA helicase RecG [Pseudopedobacter saltans DSM 12145]|uniref:ATP-dependent DNA helicase RecG n=1 Tax=Pseudopedobacter saltans (strain ATCC 51119 / DSM 12145 / JCM 21818 / CCUG 39354 / LMG 10337 / NBRC 100064 / NCIMB 13643) TaxID=762903 RepID=F0S7S7_PSESL|nr:ATP-dependent DNA helicase RecG [Pseudopedobacter saltans DSM 12145]